MFRQKATVVHDGIAGLAVLILTTIIYTAKVFRNLVSLDIQVLHASFFCCFHYRALLLVD